MKEIASSHASAPDLYGDISFDPPFISSNTESSGRNSENILDSSEIARATHDSILAAMIDLVKKQPKFDGKKSRVKKRVVLVDKYTDKKITMKLSEAQIRWIWFHRLIGRGNDIMAQINESGVVKDKHDDEGVVVLGEKEKSAGLSNQLQGVILDLRVLDGLILNNNRDFLNKNGYESLRNKMARVIETKDEVAETVSSRGDFFSKEKIVEPSWLSGTTVVPRIRPKADLIR